MVPPYRLAVHQCQEGVGLHLLVAPLVLAGHQWVVVHYLVALVVAHQAIQDTSQGRLVAHWVTSHFQVFV